MKTRNDCPETNQPNIRRWLPLVATTFLILCTVFSPIATAADMSTQAGDENATIVVSDSDQNRHKVVKNISVNETRTITWDNPDDRVNVTYLGKNGSSHVIRYEYGRDYGWSSSLRGMWPLVTQSVMFIGFLFLMYVILTLARL